MINHIKNINSIASQIQYTLRIYCQHMLIIKSGKPSRLLFSVKQFANVPRPKAMIAKNLGDGLLANPIAQLTVSNYSCNMTWTIPGILTFNADYQIDNGLW